MAETFVHHFIEDKHQFGAPSRSSRENPSSSPNNVLHDHMSSPGLKRKLDFFRRPFRFVSWLNSHNPSISDRGIEQRTALPKSDGSNIPGKIQPASLTSTNALEDLETSYRNYSRPYQAHRSSN